MNWRKSGVVWRCIASSIGREREIKLASHGIVDLYWNLPDSTGSLTMGRKLLLCALARQDIDTARDTFESMTAEAKNESMTRFLMYKIAVRCGDIELAAECLDQVSTSSSKDATLLYACVLDAAQLGNKGLRLAALQCVLEKHGYKLPNNAHLPTVLRVAIRLLVDMMDASEILKVPNDARSPIDYLCKLFECGELS